MKKKMKQREETRQREKSPVLYAHQPPHGNTGHGREPGWGGRGWGSWPSKPRRRVQGCGPPWEQASVPQHPARPRAEAGEKAQI